MRGLKPCTRGQWNAGIVGAITVLAACGFAWAGEPPAASSADQYVVGTKTAIELPDVWDSVPTMRVTVSSRNNLARPAEGGAPRDGGEPGGGEPRTGCTGLQVKTHTDFNFTGGPLTVQAGFAETEIAAASYMIPADHFPIKIELTEMIFATSGTTVTTTTQWSVLFWSGYPSTGTLVASFSSDGTILPHIVIPPGTNGVNVQFSIDPGDPEQIIIQNSGNNIFSVGYRIDQHNNQTQDPCFTPPPTNSNAFPTTDISGLSQPANNWLFGVNCGPFGCPVNGGWASFSALPGYCRPSGDWILRATYSCVNQPTGACCTSTGCLDLSASACGTVGGTYRGDGTACATSGICNGACCASNGTCSDTSQPNCTGTFQGVGTTCSPNPCPPPPTQACCFGAGPGTCLDENEADCIFIGGDPQGPGTACLANNTCPLGACCMPNGSCQDNVSEIDCLNQDGTYQGHLTQCSGVSCPQPTGACCLSNGNCVVRTQFDCSIIPGSQWAGAFTDCSDNNQNGTADICEPQCNPSWNVGDFVEFGVINGRDIQGFVTTMITPPQPGTEGFCRADINRDGVLNATDINLFVTCILVAVCPPP